ncbi:hypothetical protein DFJ58DRAFT_766662, partial [Suillus subalutaceus]|uniref:uncharacterized protein n=1 Tax=Suillus subalutaceus TaxID=48586 RepID=UPI001B879520
KGAGLDELLLDQHDKSVLAADATRRPVRQPIKVSNRISQGFFDGTPHRVHSFAQLDLHDAPSRPNIFIGLEIFSLPDSVEQTSSCASVAQRSSTFHIARHNVNASAREKRGPTIPLKSKKPAASISESRPPNSNVIQSSGAAEPQSSSQPHIVASTSTAHPVVANTTSSTNLHATMKHAGRWTRFWLFVCCASPEYTDGHH